MPISITQALDLPVAVVLIMFIPIGLWRGALREWVACAGIALGTLLADVAGTRWGEGFAKLANMDPKLGGFTVATGFFLVATLLIGYGGGVTLPYRPDLSWLNRGLGALLGLGNGFLVIGGLLRLMQERLFDGRSNSPLHTAALAAFLIDTSVAWVYLGLFVGLLLCVILGLIRRVNDGTPLLEEYSPIYHVTAQGDWASAAQWRPQPISAETWSTDAATNGHAVPDRATQVLQLGTEPTTTANAPSNGDVSPPRTGKSARPQVANLDRPTPRPATSAPTQRAARHRDAQRVPPITEQSTTNVDRESTILPIADPSPAAEMRQKRDPVAPEPVELTVNCAICGSPLAAQARFCSNCGHLTGAAEQRQIARQR